MKNEKEFCRLRCKITGDIQETKYTIAVKEPDHYDPDLIWFYLVSEFNDDNDKYEPKYNLRYAEFTNNEEGLLV